MWPHLSSFMFVGVLIPRFSSIASEISRVQPSEELRNRAVERESDRDDLTGRGISLPTLDPTNVVPVGLALAGERFLR